MPAGSKKGQAGSAVQQWGTDMTTCKFSGTTLGGRCSQGQMAPLALTWATRQVTLLPISGDF